MGEVYEAAHARLAHRYAVKFLHPGVRDHPEALPRFMREAQITSRLRHPGIVSVIDFDTLPSGLAYLVMEYLDGESLGKLLRRTGRLPLTRVVDITDQIASALTAAHLQGVVHRDMHPQNIFVVPGTGGQSDRIKILDFGISKMASISQKITGMAAVMGTPQYMSPEQAEGKVDELDASSDQFSMAAIVYEMLTGRPAFSGETLASIAYQIVHAHPAGVRTLRPELPVEMEAVVARGLAKNKKDRFPSVSEFAVHLRWTATLPPGEVPSKSLPTQTGPTEVGFDVEETTAVSKLPSDMAAVLRESTGDVTARNNALSTDDQTPAVAPVDDESTVVSPPSGDDESTVVNPPDIANPTVVGRPPAPPRPPTVVHPPVVLRPAAVVNSRAAADMAAALNPPAARRPPGVGLRPAIPERPPIASAPPFENRKSAQHELTNVDAPRNRMPVIATVVASCLLAVVIVIGAVSRRGRATAGSATAGSATAGSAPAGSAPAGSATAGSTPAGFPGAAGAPIATAPPPASARPAPAAADPSSVPAPAPARAPAPAAGTERPDAPAAAAAADLDPDPMPPPAPTPERQRSRGRERPRGAVPPRAPAPVAAASVPKVAPTGETCRITVGTYPWSELWVDGADTGQQTPVVGLPIACGPHRLQFKRRDLKIDQVENVTVTEGREFRRQYELQGSDVDD